MAAKKKPIEVRFDELDEISIAEIVGICHHLGHTTTHVLMSKDALIDVLMGDPPPDDPVEEVRESIKAFVAANRLLINKSLLNCNLKCDTCPVTRVVECYTDHKDEIG